jgi:hypothetical protein
MQIRTTARRLRQATRPVVLAGAVELASIGLMTPREQGIEKETTDASHYATSCSGYMVAVG